MSGHTFVDGLSFSLCFHSPNLPNSGPQHGTEALTVKHVTLKEDLRANARILARKDDCEAQDRAGEWT